ncbi:hypothetical protein ACJDU8_22640 [Clostridium sp. WILCCON 0269]|uniref:Transposase n=1 Tax=Candidatus Clostridium eludens TaxID=3381663 RepID=A0ABW8ST77_9CLOT
MRKLTERTYNGRKQFIKASKKLSKKGFTVLNVCEENGKYAVEYQTRP